MSRKKKVEVPDAPKPNDLWEIKTEMQINGRHVKPGTELKITGWTGRYNFVKYVKTEKGIEWIDVIGSGKNGSYYRSCTLEMVKTVHSKNKTDKNLAKEYKEKQKAKKHDTEGS